MRTIDPANDKFKCVYRYFPNIVILNKSATSGEVKLTLAHAYVGNKYLGGYITAFALAVSLESPALVLINAEIAFAISGDKIYLLVTEAILRTAAGNLARSKKERNWAPLKTILISPFLTEKMILDGDTSLEDLLNIFARGITDRTAE